MPNRILRDYTTSEAFDGLSAEAERLFVRLLMKADDFGRFHAAPKLIRALCFPLAEDLRANTVAAWLTELSDRQLVFCYTSGTVEYLALPKFGQRVRSDSKSKFPAPDGEPENWHPPHSAASRGDPPQVAASYVFGVEGGDGGGDDAPPPPPGWPDVDKVLGYAKDNAAGPLRTDVCMAWMESRQIHGYRRPGPNGNTYEIADWRADLRKFNGIFLENERKDKAANSGGGMVDKSGTRWTST